MAHKRLVLNSFEKKSKNQRTKEIASAKIESQIPYFSRLCDRANWLLENLKETSFLSFFPPVLFSSFLPNALISESSSLLRRQQASPLSLYHTGWFCDCCLNGSDKITSCDMVLIASDSTSSYQTGRTSSVKWGDYVAATWVVTLPATKRSDD